MLWVMGECELGIKSDRLLSGPPIRCFDCKHPGLPVDVLNHVELMPSDTASRTCADEWVFGSSWLWWKVRLMKRNNGCSHRKHRFAVTNHVVSPQLC